MNIGLKSTLACALVCIISLSGCASQAILDLTKRSVENQKILAEEQGLISNAFAQQLAIDEQMVKIVGAEMTKQCEAINLSAQKQAEALIAGSKLKARELFYQQSWVYQHQEYAKKFNTAYEPLAAMYEVYNIQLQELDRKSKLKPQDVSITREILEKQTQILSISNRNANDDLELRDILSEKIEGYRTQLFSDIEQQYATINMPAKANCSELSDQTQQIASELVKLQASLAAHYAQLDTLNDNQLQTLITLQNNVDKSPIYKLILEGASDKLKSKLNSATAKFQSVLAPLTGKFEQFLGKVSATANQGLSGLTANLQLIESGFSDKINRTFSQFLDGIPEHVNNLIYKHSAKKTPDESKGE